MEARELKRRQNAPYHQHSYVVNLQVEKNFLSPYQLIRGYEKY